jgi:hypothetical protein
MSKSNPTFNRPDNGTYCPDCKHFTWCDWGKIHATALSIYPCRDFENNKKEKGDNKDDKEQN